jgi:hypothetical protein
MARRDLHLLLFLAFAAMGWELAQSVAGLSEGFALLAPALLFALPLLAGRYVGEEALERLRISRAVPPARRRRTRAARVPRLRRAERPAVRGGLLLAAHLAHRPPPALG